MIATLANEEFQSLYEIDINNVTGYAEQKDAIFSRYRTLAEILGVLLVKRAQRQKLNVMIETSGRDIAMYDYVNHCFPAETYNKLVVHFVINDISFAERSVDLRMLKEMKNGKIALLALQKQQQQQQVFRGTPKTSTGSSGTGTMIDADTAATGTSTNGDDSVDGTNGRVTAAVRELIRVNAGGPYGSQVLKGVQADSQRVWTQVCAEPQDSDNNNNNGSHDNDINKRDHNCDSSSTVNNSVSQGWFKACLSVTANAEDSNLPWTVQALPYAAMSAGIDGVSASNASASSVFSFEWLN
mmetsp:Transcript_26213/g.44234  ORF Transcript_26213/g.44234 Transcript_26213/m.44234 type:complete len:298 (-) Transcript_26213:8-901(-)